MILTDTSTPTKSFANLLSLQMQTQLFSYNLKGPGFGDPKGLSIAKNHNQERPKHNHNHNFPKKFCIWCHTKTAFDDTSDEKSLPFLCVPLCRRAFGASSGGTPKMKNWAPRDELKNGRGRGWAGPYIRVLVGSHPRRFTRTSPKTLADKFLGIPFLASKDCNESVGGATSGGLSKSEEIWGNEALFLSFQDFPGARGTLRKRAKKAGKGRIRREGRPDTP